MKKICIVTATRAEYGLLRPIIAALNTVKEFDVKIVATGMHLSPEFGLTYKEVEQDGFLIDKKIEVLLSSDSPVAISKAMALAIIGFADYFEESKPDLLVVDGDRYEILAVCIAAMNQKIPVAHIGGGATTEGAIDECIRHAITKMSYIHFTSMDTNRNRIIQLGESPERVHKVGSVGIENIKKTEFYSKEELEYFLKFDLDKPYAVITFHPVTLEKESAGHQIKELLKACAEFENMKFIFTKANADEDGRIINKMIDSYVKENSNSKAYESLGSKGYYSALKYSTMVIGNSSSGIIEAPSFGIPTINIGDRQRGRVQAMSIINCLPLKQEIVKAINLANSEEFRKIAQKAVNPNGDGNTSEKILQIVKDLLLSGKEIDLKKKFYEGDVM